MIHNEQVPTLKPEPTKTYHIYLESKDIQVPSEKTLTIE